MSGRLHRKTYFYMIAMSVVIFSSGLIPKEYFPLANAALGVLTGILGIKSVLEFCKEQEAQWGFSEKLSKNRPFLFSIGLGITSSLAAGVAILSQLPFDFSVSGFGYFFENSKLPFALLTGGIAAAGFVASIHRSEQTSKQIEQADFNQRLSIHQDQEDKFNKAFEKFNAGNNTIVLKHPVLLLELFPYPSDNNSTMMDMSFFDKVIDIYSNGPAYCPSMDKKTIKYIEKIGGPKNIMLHEIIKKPPTYEILVSLQEYKEFLIKNKNKKIQELVARIFGNKLKTSISENDALKYFIMILNQVEESELAFFIDEKEVQERKCKLEEIKIFSRYEKIESYELNDSRIVPEVQNEIGRIIEKIHAIERNLREQEACHSSEIIDIQGFFERYTFLVNEKCHSGDFGIFNKNVNQKLEDLKIINNSVLKMLLLEKDLFPNVFLEKLYP